MQNGMNRITFGNKPSAVIALNSTMPSREEFESLAGIPIIAADGACLRLEAIGISPDFIVGDLDSLRQSGRYDDFINSEMLEMPDQETNDFEKSLNFAISKGWHSVLVVGFHGGELDHTLNNISVLKKYANRMEICLYEHKRYSIYTEVSFALKSAPGEIISLVPMPIATVTTGGLEWPLRNERLELGVREGARNRAISAEISVEIHSGALLVFFDSHQPFMPSVG